MLCGKGLVWQTLLEVHLHVVTQCVSVSFTMPCSIINTCQSVAILDMAKHRQLRKLCKQHYGKYGSKNFNSTFAFNHIISAHNVKYCQLFLYFVHGTDAKYCNQHVCIICLFVCLSARLSHKPYIQISQNFLYTVCGQGSVLL